MLKKPYFMKNKDWFYKTKLADTDTFNLTEIGKSIPEVFKSYKEYYNIKDEDLYEYGSDLESEFKIWSTKTIRKKMQEHGASNKEINEFVNEWLNIENIISLEDKEVVIKNEAHFEKEFETYYAQKNKLKTEPKQINKESNNTEQQAINRIIQKLKTNKHKH